MASASLTGIFAPGAPALAESLRTLTVSSARTIAPGETIRAEFAFSNLGGAPATGVRVRFSLPPGVTHVDEDLVDDRPLLDGERLADPEGAAVGDLEPGAQRRVVCSFRVHDTIEDGSELVLQAALVTAETPLVASNIERLVVRSRPVLENAQTALAIVAPEDPKPNAVLTVRATIANTGASSAHDVVAILPVPEHTAYVPRSARVGGRLLLGKDGEVFDYDAGTVVAERLAPGQSVAAEYQVTIDAPLADGTRIAASGTIASRECAELDVTSNEIVVRSPVDFDNEETALTLLCDDVVTPGMRIPISVRALNAGTGDATGVTITFELPPGLLYAPASAHLDEQPVGDAAFDEGTFTIGELSAGRAVDVGFVATVAVPHDDDRALPVTATLRWRGGARSFARALQVRVAPRFTRARNVIAAQRGRAFSREDVGFAIRVYNDGTASERNVRLRLIPGAYLENVRIAELPAQPAAYAEPLELGAIDPHAERVFAVLARVASPVPDRSNVTLGAVLEHDAGSIDVGTASVTVRSRPRIAHDAVAWELLAAEPLRPHRTADVLLRFTNDGSDVLRDARLALKLPAELAVERAVNARRDRDGLRFGDVPAHTTHEARMTLRLLRPVRNGAPLTLEGWLHGGAISPVQFAPLDVPTYAQPQFGGAALHASPSETIDAGDRVAYELLVRNDGDGPAERLTIRVVPANLAVYVPGSTTLNGVQVPDDGGLSPLWAQRGLALADVTPGVELRVRFEMIVMTPLAAGTSIETRAVLEWDEGQSLALAAPALRVLAQPELAETSAGTPISIARIFAPPAPEQPPAVVEDDAPAAAPELRHGAPYALADLIGGATQLGNAPPTPAGAPIAYADFSLERLVQTLRFLERTDAGGLIRHLFAVRAFFPTGAVNAPPDLTRDFTAAAAALRAPLDRFFVRLRMPRLNVTARDLEDRDGRDALRALVEALLAQPPAFPTRAEPAEPVRVQGAVNLDALRALAPDLESAPLGAATPWLVSAQLLGETIVRDGNASDELGAYRRALQNTFARLSELPIEEFHRVLVSSTNRTLDDALTAVLDALRAAAHLAVD